MTHNGQNKQNIKTKTVAFDLGRVETPTLAGRVEPFCINFASRKLIMLQKTYAWMPCLRIIFSTFSECMNFHTAKTHERRAPWKGAMRVGLRGQSNASRNSLSTRGIQVACRCGYNAK